MPVENIDPAQARALIEQFPDPETGRPLGTMGQVKSVAVDNGTVAATIALTLLSPLVVDIALKFGPAEYFAVMVLAFTTVSAVLGASPLRGIAALFFGLFLGLMGIDTQTTLSIASSGTSMWRNSSSLGSRVRAASEIW